MFSTNFSELIHFSRLCLYKLFKNCDLVDHPFPLKTKILTFIKFHFIAESLKNKTNFKLFVS